VVEKYCEKSGLDYKGIMCRFIDHLIQEKGYGVLIIANAARAGKTGRKNNDLPVCQAVYDGVQNKERCRWYPEEFTPEAIREFIGLSQLMVASRFHAMIGALYKGVPVLLVGWSHKYKEVLDMFKLGRSAIDYKKLDYDDLVAAFSALEAEQDEIRTKIRTHLGAVQRCAYKNIEMILEALGASGGEK
jgi:polysaccharide pyruvyl transferase WcaK-like protein